MPPMPDIHASIQTAIANKDVLRNPATPAPTPGSKEAYAKKMLDLIDQGQSRQALETARTPQVNRIGLATRVDDMGYHRDAASGEKDYPGTRGDLATERGRHDEAIKYRDIAVKFIDHGYDAAPGTTGGLTVREQNTLRDLVRDQVNVNPDQKAAFDAATDKTKFLEDIIRDPKYAPKVREALQRFVQREALQDTVSEKADVLREKGIDREARNSELEDINRRLMIVTTQQGDFLRATPAVPLPPGAGAKALALDTARTEIVNERTDLAARIADRDSVTGAIRQLEMDKRTAPATTPAIIGAASVRTKAMIDVEIAAKQSDLVNAETDVATARTRVEGRQATIAELEGQEAALETQRQQLETEKAAKKAELDKAELAVTKAQREHVDIIAQRPGQEMDIVNELKGVFAEGANEVLNEEIRALAEKYDAVIEEFKQKAKEGHERAFWEQEDKRYVLATGGARGARSVDISRVNGDFGILMTRGQEAYVRQVLTNAINPDTGARYQPAEIDARIADKDFMDAVKDKATTLILARKDMLKGGISKQDAYAIATSTWGRQLLEDAYNNNDQARDIINKNGGRDALNNPNFLARVKKEWGGKSLLWLLLLGLPLGAAAWGAATSP
jgi:hypothetical protein